jgi:ABC-type sugar transport system ATPase subunit
VSQEGCCAHLQAAPVGKLTIPLAPGIELGLGRYTVGLRPEAIRVGTAGDVSFNGEIAAKEVLGNLGYLYLDITSKTRLIVEVSSSAHVGRHEKHPFSFDIASCHLFDDKGVAVPLCRTTSTETIK